MEERSESFNEDKNQVLQQKEDRDSEIFFTYKALKCQTDP